MTHTYKQTDVGMIPADWEVKRLGEMGEALIGLTYSPNEVSDHGTLVLRSSNIQHDSLNFDDNVYVNTQIPEKIMVRPGDVLICVRNGSRSLIGKALYLDELTLGMTFGAFMSVYRSSIGKLVSYLFQSDILKKQISEHLGATINQITNKSLNSFVIPLPPLPEQRAIAAALSDVDALIGALEALIAKKRAIKQATMQQLLTGQTRLPGFATTTAMQQTEVGLIPADWEVTTLGQIISRFSTGLNPRQNFRLNSGGNYFYVTIRNFTIGQLLLDDNCDRIDEAAFWRINERSDLRKDDILFSSIGRVGDAYLITETPRNWNINESVFTLRPDKSKVVPLMLFYLLTNKTITDALSQGATGSTFQSIKQAQLKLISCQIPQSLAEQTAIAAVLSDMDAELTALEAQLHKTRAIKQGMMQELLTGKTRLIVN